MKKIFLKSKKAASVRRYHPWVFSGAIERMEAPVQDGEIVEVYDQKGTYLATGHFQEGSIMVRLFSFEKTTADQAFWNDKIADALTYRKLLGLTDRRDTNCFRLVHAEGDGLPGLIIDVYDQTAVVQCHSIGMHHNKMEIATALKNALGEQLTAVYDKSRDSLPSNYSSQVDNGYLLGKESRGIVREYGHQFSIDWKQGQKTGFFLDQRENRQLVKKYAHGKAVLNTFAYSGGFSIYALAAGARQVDSVDVSQAAIDLIEKNMALNAYEKKAHRSHKADVLSFLKNIGSDQYDMIILDPPAFAKNVKKRHNAVQGYKRLNATALKKIGSGGMLWTFSCSQVVDKTLFYNTIVAAAHEAGKRIKVMHRLSQPADHPVSLFHPEGEYLKGLVLYII